VVQDLDKSVSVGFSLESPQALLFNRSFRLCERARC